MAYIAINRVSAVFGTAWQRVLAINSLGESLHSITRPSDLAVQTTSRTRQFPRNLAVTIDIPAEPALVSQMEPVLSRDGRPLNQLMAAFILEEATDVDVTA